MSADAWVRRSLSKIAIRPARLAISVPSLITALAKMRAMVAADRPSPSGASRRTFVPVWLCGPVMRSPKPVEAGWLRLNGNL